MDEGFAGFFQKSVHPETRRAPAMDGRRFRIEAGCRVRKFPRHRKRLERFWRHEEGAFFWLLFFAPAKKSNSPEGESPALQWLNPVRHIAKSRINGVSPLRASYFLLLAQKKVTKENGLLVRSRSLKEGGVTSPFSDSPSWLGPKTAAIHGRRPSGVRFN